MVIVWQFHQNLLSHGNGTDKTAMLEGIKTSKQKGLEADPRAAALRLLCSDRVGRMSISPATQMSITSYELETSNLCGEVTRQIDLCKGN